MPTRTRCWTGRLRISSTAMDTLAGEIKVNVGSTANWGGEDALAESKAALELIRERMQAAQEDAPAAHRPA